MVSMFSAKMFLRLNFIYLTLFKWKTRKGFRPKKRTQNPETESQRDQSNFRGYAGIAIITRRALLAPAALLEKGVIRAQNNNLLHKTPPHTDINYGTLYNYKNISSLGRTWLPALVTLSLEHFSTAAAELRFGSLNDRTDRSPRGTGTGFRPRNTAW